MDIDRQEGISLRKLRHGGYLVCHPEIYNLGALWFAASTIEEALKFMRETMGPPSDGSAETSGQG